MERLTGTACRNESRLAVAADGPHECQDVLRGVFEVDRRRRQPTGKGQGAKPCRAVCANGCCRRLSPRSTSLNRDLGTTWTQSPGNPLISWRARQESNLYQELRKLSFYPLNYGREEAVLYPKQDYALGRLPAGVISPRGLPGFAPRPAPRSPGSYCARDAGRMPVGTPLAAQRRPCTERKCTPASGGPSRLLRRDEGGRA